MTEEFSTTAEILFEPDEGSLRSVRKQVEEIGPVTVEYESTRNPIAADGGRRGRGRRGTGASVTAGTSASEPGGVVGILAESLEVQEAMLDHLDDINEDTDLLGMSGGGGGDGIFSFLSEEGGDIVGGLGEQLTNVIGNSVGTAIGNAFTDKSVSVKKPDWVPIEVEDPGEVPVNEPGKVDVDAPDSIDVDSPESIDVDAPDAIDVDAPGSISVDDPSPLSVEDTTLPVEDVDPLPVEEPTVTVHIEGGRGGDSSSSDGQTTDSNRFKEFGGGFSLADIGFDFGLATANGGDTGFKFNVGPSVGMNLGTGRFNSAPSTGSPSTGARDARDVSVSTRSNTSVTVDPRGMSDLRKDILSAVKDAQRETREELQSEIDALEKEFQRLRDDITRAQ